MNARGLSTAVDVAFCILLIGASVATLSTAVPSTPAAAPSSTPAAVTIASVTNASNPVQRGTLAERLATLAVADARHPDSTQVPRTTLNTTVTSLPGNVHVVAQWTPYPDAHTIGQAAVGEPPPPTATVTTARFTVPLPTTTSAATLRQRAQDGGYPAVARTVALGIRSHLHARCPGLDAVRSGDCTDPDPSSTGLEPLTTRIEASLRDRYESPTLAADAVAVDSVTIIVRRWTP